jgi:hypothetical protein
MSAGAEKKLQLLRNAPSMDKARDKLKQDIESCTMKRFSLAKDVLVSEIIHRFFGCNLHVPRRNSSDVGNVKYKTPLELACK